MTREEFLERIDEIMCGTSNAERACLEDLYNEVTTKALLNKLEKRFEEYENKVYEEISYMNKHGFKMEVEALRYKAEAYNRCKLDIF